MSILVGGISRSASNNDATSERMNGVRVSSSSDGSAAMRAIKLVATSCQGGPPSTRHVGRAARRLSRSRNLHRAAASGGAYELRR